MGNNPQDPTKDPEMLANVEKFNETKQARGCGAAIEEAAKRAKEERDRKS